MAAERSNAPAFVAIVVVAAVVFGAAVWVTRPSGDSHDEAAEAHEHPHPAITLYDINDPAQVVAMTGAAAPTLSATVKRAGDGGWDLKLDTSRFKYLPEDAATITVVPGEGHAHLYIDGTYVNQFSSGNLHLEPLPPGVHTIDVGLYAVDHRAYVADGKLLAQRVVVQVPQPGKGPKTPGTAKTYALALAKGKVTGSDTLRVTQNDALELRWTSDVPATLHLEGYDIEFQVSPQLPVLMLLDATLVGRFPVQGHGADDRDTGAVMYLEVYP